MIVTLSVRVLQIIFGTIILGLAGAMVSDFGPGSGPAIVSYSVFCGAWVLLAALIGVAACFVEAIQGLVMLVIDGLGVLFLFAGGVAYAAIIKVGSCTNPYYLSDHQNPFYPSNDKYFPDDQSAVNDVERRCRESQAITAFLWFEFACFVASAALSFVGGRGRGSRSIV